MFWFTKMLTVRCTMLYPCNGPSNLNFNLIYQCYLWVWFTYPFSLNFNLIYRCLPMCMVYSYYPCSSPSNIWISTWFKCMVYSLHHFVLFKQKMHNYKITESNHLRVSFAKTRTMWAVSSEGTYICVYLSHHFALSFLFHMQHSLR